MALSASIDYSDRNVQAEPSIAGGGSNDAFSFWKLPDAWKASLESAIDELRVLAEHYLFEEYLAREERRPPTRMHALATGSS